MQCWYIEALEILNLSFSGSQSNTNINSILSFNSDQRKKFDQIKELLKYSQFEQVFKDLAKNFHNNYDNFMTMPIALNDQKPFEEAETSHSFRSNGFLKFNKCLVSEN